MQNKPEQHTCGGPKFGRRTRGCPRCDQLTAGAAPIDRSARPEAVGTKHTCCPPGRGPAFGRKTPGCPRCDELLAGSPAREAHAGHLAAQRRAHVEADIARRIREHDCHTAGCGPICTAFQW